MSSPTSADIERLAAQFVASGWGELRVTIGDTQILFSTDPDTPSLGAQVASAPAPRPASDKTAATAATSAAKHVPVDPAWTAIEAPNLGTFYRSPKPGAAPFVNVGDRVAADSEICLIEVMKLFTSVKAGIAGIVRQVCAEDAELVDAGRILFYIGKED